MNKRHKKNLTGFNSHFGSTTEIKFVSSLIIHTVTNTVTNTAALMQHIFISALTNNFRCAFSQRLFLFPFSLFTNVEQ